MRDLYVFEANGGSGPLAGKLIDLTADHNVGEHADVLGVMGASEDGTSVYFVANGALGAGSKQETANGRKNRPARRAMSMWRAMTKQPARGRPRSWSRRFPGPTSRVGAAARVTSMS